MISRLGLTPKLTILFIIFALLVISGLGVLVYSNGRDALITAAKSELLSKAVENEASLNDWAEENLSRITILARTPSVVRNVEALIAAEPNTPEAKVAHDRLLADLLPRIGSDRLFLSILIIEPVDGRVVASSDPSEEGTFKESLPYFVNGLKNPFIQNVYYSPAEQGPAMTVSSPLHSTSGKLIGVMAGQLNVDNMNEIILRRTGLRKTDDAFLVNTASLFVTQPRLTKDIDLLRRGIHTESVTECLKRTSGIIQSLDYRGVPAIIVYRWLPEREMCLIVKMDEEEALAPVHAFGRSVLLFGGLILLIASFLGYGLSRAVTRPIRSLQKGVALLGESERGVEIQVPETGFDELGDLAREFNKMARSISEKEILLRSHAVLLENEVRERTKELNSSLVESERLREFNRRILDAMVDGLLSDDPDGKITFVNNTLLRMIGRTAEEVIGQHWSFIIPPEEHPRVERELVRRREGAATTYESKLLARDGRTIDVLLSAAPLFIAGEFSGTVANFTDQTERKRLQAERDSLFDNSLDLLCVAGFDGYFKQLNPAWEKTLGWTIDELLSKPYIEFVHPEDREATLNVAGEVVGGKLLYAFDNRYVCKDGSYRWLSWNAYPVIESQITNALARDITDRKLASEKLFSLNQRFELARQSANMGVWDWDVVNNTLVWDDQMYRLYGVKGENFDGAYSAWVAGLHPEDAEASQAEVQMALRGEKPFDTQFRVLWPDGTTRHIKAFGSVDRNESGEPIRMIGVNYDITDQVTAQEQLQRAMQDLAQSNADLEQFAYVASHDLQEPLRMVSSYVQLLAKRYKGKLDSDADEFIDFAVDGATRMKRLINDLLSYSRVGTRGNPLVSIACDDVLNQALENLQVAIQDNDAKIIRKPLPIVEGDETQLIQLFQNLIGNALKFRGEKPPQIRISAEYGQKEWIFSIQDNGIGMESQYLERIFVIFQRLQARDQYPGTGIGLAVCKKIVERHGGRIWAESKPAQGSVFFFTLPATKTNGMDPAKSQKSDEIEHRARNII